ncbi:MAG: PTS sugar transporter subunit IIC [Erysipelotrichaceae bacterium]|nr:PTS sugar transporter subunit IIC [Erysipelotrichaceae bacterium]
MSISWLQAGLLGFMSVLAASTPAALGTTVGNYTLNRPLVASLFVGLILGDVPGAITIAIPMQIIYIALVTPGGTVAADLRAVSYIGIPLAYVTCVSQGLDLAGAEAQGIAGALGALVGTVGTVMFYGTAMMNLFWQHYGWARLDKGDFNVLTKVEVFLPIVTHIVISFIPVTILVYYGAGAVENFKSALPMEAWYMKALFTLGSLLPAVGIAILLKSVINKTTDLIYFVGGFALAKSLGLSLLAATAIGGMFAFVNFQIAMASYKGASSGADDEEDI